MSISKIKKNKKGFYVDFEYEKKLQNSNEYFRKKLRKYLDSDLSKTNQHQQAKLMYADFLRDAEEEYLVKNSTKKNSNCSKTSSLSEFVDVYLNYIYETKSLSYYSCNLGLSKLVKEKIGNTKLKDLNPIIIQEFYNYVGSMKSSTSIVVPNQNFSKTIDSISYNSNKFSREINSGHYKYLKDARDGKKVSKKWAEDFSKYLGVPFNKLFKIDIDEKEYSFTTKKKYATFLKACLAEAKRKLLIKENYAKSEYTSFMKNPEPNKERKIMDENTFIKFYDIIQSLDNSPQKTFFTIMMNTGARREEVLGLKWENIDLVKQTLEFCNTVVKVTGFGTRINENATKNKSSNRIINISAEVVNVLNDYKKISNDAGYLFTNKENKIIGPSCADRWLKSILKKNNMEHYTLHSLRHSYATIMINYIPLADVSKTLGHSQISTTLNIYTHNVDKKEARNIKDIISNSKIDETIKAYTTLRDNGELSNEEYDKIIEKINKN